MRSGTTLASASYTVDAVSNRSDRTDLAGTQTYSYDNDYRLTSVVYPGPTTTSYTYDAFGNRATMVDGSGTTNYSYDDAGRLTTVTPPSPASAISYTWDVRELPALRRRRAEATAAQPTLVVAIAAASLDSANLDAGAAGWPGTTIAVA